MQGAWRATSHCCDPGYMVFLTNKFTETLQTLHSHCKNVEKKWKYPNILVRMYSTSTGTTLSPVCALLCTMCAGHPRPMTSLWSAALTLVWTFCLPTWFRPQKLVLLLSAEKATTLFSSYSGLCQLIAGSGCGILYGPALSGKMLILILTILQLLVRKYLYCYNVNSLDSCLFLCRFNLFISYRLWCWGCSLRAR